METSELLDQLRAELSADAVLTDADATDSYARDMMPLAPNGKPLAVVLPRDAVGVQATVRLCAQAGVPIVPRGAGSGLSGAANAIDGCVMLVTTRLNKILEIDAGNRLATVQHQCTKQLRRPINGASRGLDRPLGMRVAVADAITERADE